MSESMKERALMEAIGRHQDRVFRLAVACLKSRADAEDVMQEVFLKYYRFAPEFADPEHEKAWLLRVTANACISFLRSPWQRFLHPIPESTPAPEGPDVCEGQWLIDLVHRLPARYAAVIHLHYYEDYSVREIASILHISEGTVKSRLARARRQLGDLIKKEEEFNGKESIQARL